MWELPKASSTLFTTGSGPEQQQPLETHACNANGEVARAEVEAEGPGQDMWSGADSPSQARNI